MGERFTFFRLPKVEDKDLIQRAMKNAGHERTIRSTLADAVAGLFAHRTMPTEPYTLSATEEERLIALASLAARCRSAVERDPHTRDIDLVPDPEVPGRLALTLLRLFAGMRGIGVPDEARWRVLVKIAKDSMPALRLSILERLYHGQDKLKTSEIAIHVRHPSQTTRRALEDLTAHGVVIRHEKHHEKDADLWGISDWADKHLRVAEGAFPETSGGEYSR
jgi:hypothetical protein